MTEEREESVPYWLKSAAPFGPQGRPPSVPPSARWPFPPINRALLDAIDWSKVPILPAAPPWFPSAAPATKPAPAAEHLDSGNYWGAAPALPGTTPTPLSTGGILGSLGQRQYGDREPPAWPQARNAFGESQPLSTEPDLVREALRAGAATVARHSQREKIPPAAQPIPTADHVDADRYYLAPVPQAPTWEQTVTTATPWSPLAKSPSQTSWGELTNGIDCRTSGGNTSCITPGGHQFNIPGAFPDGLTIAPGQPRYHYYSKPDGPVRFDLSALTQGVIDNPTVGPPQHVHPATPRGTLNEATPTTLYDELQAFLRGGAVPPVADLPFNPVKSYLVKDQNGLPMIVNITQPEHGLHPGIVVRYVTESPSGATIQNEGSGLGLLQTRSSPIADEINGVWQGHAQDIIRKMQQGGR